MRSSATHDPVFICSQVLNIPQEDQRSSQLNRSQYPGAYIPVTGLQHEGLQSSTKRAICRRLKGDTYPTECFVSGPSFRSRPATVDHEDHGDHSEPLSFGSVRSMLGATPVDQYAFAALRALLFLMPYCIPQPSQLQSLLDDGCLVFSFQIRI